MTTKEDKKTSPKERAKKRKIYTEKLDLRITKEQKQFLSRFSSSKMIREFINREMKKANKDI